MLGEFIFPVASFADESLNKTLTNGKLDFSAHYRFEHVDDNTASDTADASTIRTTLGYNTSKFHHFNARLLLQDVRDIFVDDFNDGTARNNVKTNHAVVVDPSDTAFIESYISFDGIAKTTFKAGRQIITYRNDPFHRFLGSVPWRQNWQNHDAFSIQNKSISDTIINYAYSWNINRIFSDRAIGVRANFDSNSHFFNIKYSGLSHASLETYAYLQDFENSTANSLEIYGARFDGKRPLSDKLKAIYSLEYATEWDYGDNILNVDEDYFQGELGVKLKPNEIIQAVLLKFNYELLGGDGIASFQTPLGTNHAYQGWADRFLTTPVDGIEDYYITIAAKILGTRFIVSYHDINSNNQRYDYGSEIDLQFTKTLMKHYIFGLKFAAYNADRNLTNITNNGAASGIANNVSKFWIWMQIKF